VAGLKWRGAPGARWSAVEERRSKGKALLVLLAGSGWAQICREGGDCCHACSADLKAQQGMGSAAGEEVGMPWLLLVLDLARLIKEEGEAAGSFPCCCHGEGRRCTAWAGPAGGAQGAVVVLLLLPLLRLDGEGGGRGLQVEEDEDWEEAAVCVGGDEFRDLLIRFRVWYQ